MKLPNISFVQYYNLKDRSYYNYALKFADIKPKDLFRIGKLTQKSFGLVKDLQAMFNRNDFITWDEFFTEVKKMTKISKPKLADKKLFDLHAFRLYLYEEIKEINEREESNLSHKADAKEHQAGIEDFGKYGAFLQFDNLARGDVLKYDDIRKLPYDVCFTKLLLDAERNEFQQRLTKLNK